MKHFRLLIHDPGDVWWVNSPVPKPSIPGMSSPKLRRKKNVKIAQFPAVSEPLTQRRLAYPWTPFFGGLLLNWRVCLCLNLGGPLRGVAGPPLTRVADLISALGSRFILPAASEDAPLVCSRGDLYVWETGKKQKAIHLVTFTRVTLTGFVSATTKPSRVCSVASVWHTCLDPLNELTAAGRIYGHISMGLNV